MNILAIDTSIGITSVAVRRAGQTLSYLENRESTMQAAVLVPLIERALMQAKTGYSELTHIASTVGPGSFTGIRIGLATARAIAFARNIPCLGYTTLAVMAKALGTRPTLAIVNAGKGEVFFEYFDGTHGKPAIGKLEEILAAHPQANIACSVPLPAGYGAPAIAFPRADALAALAEEAGECALPPEPYYIRPPDAKPQMAV